MYSHVFFDYWNAFDSAKDDKLKYLLKLIELDKDDQKSKKCQQILQAGHIIVKNIRPNYSLNKCQIT